MVNYITHEFERGLESGIESPGGEVNVCNFICASLVVFLLSVVSLLSEHMFGCVFWSDDCLSKLEFLCSEHPD